MSLPYVYKCVNRETGEFYFGYRSRNTKPAAEDLGVTYFTSSKVVKPVFDQFDYEILLETSTKLEAHAYEQALIKEQWLNPLLLNRALFPKIRNFGQSEKQKSKARERMLTNNPAKLPENREKARIRATGRLHTDEWKAAASKRNLGRKIPNRKSPNQSGAANPSAKRYTFISPEGTKYEVYGRLYQFSRDQQLGYNSCIALAKGRRESYKGWTVI